jgi:HEAT repeat protein
LTEERVALALALALLLATGVDVARHWNEWIAPLVTGPRPLAAPAPAPAPAIQREVPSPGAPPEPAAREAALFEADAALARALDERADLAARLDAVRELARLDSEAALEGLEQVLASDAPSSVKAAAAETLGQLVSHPRAAQVLEGLLASNDDVLLRGALRGIAASGGRGAVGVLEAFLLNPAAPEPVRVEAALLLGSLDDPEAHRALARGFQEAESPAFRNVALERLGSLPYPTVDRFFRRILDDPDLSPELKVVALEALGESTPEAASLLLEYARRAPEPELRAAAIHGAAALDGAEGTRPAFVRLLDAERSPEVRAELYRALASDGADAYRGTRPTRLMQRILAEDDERARLEGSRLVASMLRAHSDPRLSAPFDESIVPWLREEALEGRERYTRRIAIYTLRLAGTPASIAALRDLASSDRPDTAQAAEDALYNLAVAAGER